MKNVQIYPHVFDDWSQPGYHEGYKAGYEAGESKGFYRGVNTVFWFFYRILNGGKTKDPSGEITRV